MIRLEAKCFSDINIKKPYPVLKTNLLEVICSQCDTDAIWHKTTATKEQKNFSLLDERKALTQFLFCKDPQYRVVLPPLGQFSSSAVKAILEQEL
jgi:hypothetical protein